MRLYYFGRLSRGEKEAKAIHVREFIFILWALARLSISRALGRHLQMTSLWILAGILNYSPRSASSDCDLMKRSERENKKCADGLAAENLLNRRNYFGFLSALEGEKWFVMLSGAFLTLASSHHSSEWKKGKEGMRSETLTRGWFFATGYSLREGEKKP